MKLTNEPVLFRAFLGALLGTLVTVLGVNLAPAQIESILGLSDAALALLPALLALIGTISARWSVDGPETAREKAETIVRLESVLSRASRTSSSEGPRISDRKETPFTALIVLMPMLFVSCATFQEAKPYLQTADAVAQNACAVFFGKQKRMSVQEAADAFCSVKEQYQPWLDELLRADRAVERSLPRGE